MTHDALTREAILKLCKVGFEGCVDLPHMSGWVEQVKALALAGLEAREHKADCRCEDCVYKRAKAYEAKRDANPPTEEVDERVKSWLELCHKTPEGEYTHEGFILRDVLAALSALLQENERLKIVISGIDGALCNYLNGCSDPYEPVSKWDEESNRNFACLCDAYNDWHINNSEVGAISSSFWGDLQDAKALLARKDELLSELFGQLFVCTHGMGELDDSFLPSGPDCRHWEKELSLEVRRPADASAQRAQVEIFLKVRAALAETSGRVG